MTEVISDILGASGRAILNARVAGETDPERLANLASGRLNATRAELTEALYGRVTAPHRFMLQLHLTQVAALDTVRRRHRVADSRGAGPFSGHGQSPDDNAGRH